METIFRIKPLNWFKDPAYNTLISESPFHRYYVHDSREQGGVDVKVVLNVQPLQDGLESQSFVDYDNIGEACRAAERHYNNEMLKYLQAVPLEDNNGGQSE